jgi:hypothetical protein
MSMLAKQDEAVEVGNSKTQNTWNIQVVFWSLSWIYVKDPTYLERSGL